MSGLALLFEGAPSAGTVGALFAAAFFLVFLGTAYVAFKALKKVVKTAFRLIVVGVILAIGTAGSVALWYFSSDGSPKRGVPAERRR
ncbi:MAG: hypothetical protein AB7F88_18665 [Pyrinomonadaceae bacterium]